MNTYKHYKKDGNLYIFKNQPVFITILTVLIFAAAVMIYRLNMPLFALFLAAVGILIIVNFFTKKFIIDPERQTITGRHTIFVPAKTYSFKDFTNFEVFITRYMGFITTNVILSIHFEADGKDQRLTIGQSVTQKGIQKMVNETEDIMGINKSSR
ncbi:hypothetical protein [Chryseobacterium vaccae]|uniref:hypothetical protein n=1 Tax=Chryseobacterium vaccae TaxID=2604424 RepID=UPI0012955175|nr:hypothetical protein [Chryseobacterium vaccae]